MQISSSFAYIHVLFGFALLDLFFQVWTLQSRSAPWKRNFFSRAKNSKTHRTSVTRYLFMQLTVSIAQGICNHCMSRDLSDAADHPDSWWAKCFSFSEVASCPIRREMNLGHAVALDPFILTRRGSGF